MTDWRKIDDVLPGEAHRPSVLIYSPLLAAQEDFPGHAYHVSNIDYIVCGNAAKGGYTHWAPITPVEEAA